VLLAALRSDKVLYPQAARLLHNSFFVLNRSTMASCSKLSRKAVSHISKLSIDCRYDDLQYSEYQDLPECIVQVANVKVLHVLGHSSTIEKWIRAGVTQLGSVKKLIVEIDNSWDRSNGDMKYLDTCFGISSTQLKTKSAVRVKRVWEIPKDEEAVLKWQ